MNASCMRDEEAWLKETGASMKIQKKKLQKEKLREPFVKLGHHSEIKEEIEEEGKEKIYIRKIEENFYEIRTDKPHKENVMEARKEENDKGHI